MDNDDENIRQRAGGGCWREQNSKDAVFLVENGVLAEQIQKKAEELGLYPTWR